MDVKLICQTVGVALEPEGERKRPQFVSVPAFVQLIGASSRSIPRLGHLWDLLQPCNSGARSRLVQMHTSKQGPSEFKSACSWLLRPPKEKRMQHQVGRSKDYKAAAAGE
jgi:hypothetical protein